MAGACLGELVRKMGDRVLRQIIPILQAGIKEPAAATRVGVCTGLTELLENISNTQLKEHLSQLLPTIQKALVDQDPDVRQVASPLLKKGALPRESVQVCAVAALESISSSLRKQGVLNYEASFTSILLWYVFMNWLFVGSRRSICGALPGGRWQRSRQCGPLHAYFSDE